MEGKLMHAVQYDGYGGGVAGLKHVEVPIPAPGKDEVLLKLEAISLNAFDWKIQKGVARPVIPRRFPYIPGNFVRIGCGTGHTITTEIEMRKIRNTRFYVENPQINLG